jgi:CelD/BcsL family acetyltransferase involved in cellulose biosynthesis
MTDDRAVSVDLVGDFSEVRHEWQRFSAAGASPFATWAWADAWWRQWGAPGAFAVRACRRRSDGSLAAILPLCRTRRRPLRALRWIGHGPGDELGPVCSAADRPLAAAALASALADEGGVMLAERLPEEDGWEALLDGLVLEREASPVLALNGDWDAYLASRSAKLRQTLRRSERRLARARFRLADAPERLARDLDTFFELHAARFGARSAVLGARTHAFHHDVAARALADGWLRLWLVELDGRPAAAWYGFRMSGREWYYQLGWDPALARESIGLALVAYSIRAAMEDGMTEYRFLRGDEPYKARFGARETRLVTLALAASRGGCAVLGAADAVIRRAPDSIPARIARRVVARAGGEEAA